MPKGPIGFWMSEDEEGEGEDERLDEGSEDFRLPLAAKSLGIVSVVFDNNVNILRNEYLTLTRTKRRI